MRAVLYSRISTSDKGQNCEVQLAELRTYCRTRNWDIVAEFADTMSGKQSKRPQLEAMMQLVRQRRIQVVAIIRLSRLGRSVPHLITVVSEFDNYGVRLVSVNESIDLTTPNGRLQFHLFSAFAQFEADLISERIRAGLAFAKSKGIRIGRRPTVTPAIIGSILQRSAQGDSLRIIAQALGISRSAVHKIVSTNRSSASALSSADCGSNVSITNPQATSQSVT